MQHLKADDIIRLIEAPDGGFSRYALRKEASIRELILALEQTESVKVRWIITTVLGDRRAKTAIPILIRHLDDSDLDVRIYAAESLGKICDPKAGPALLALFQNRAEPPELRTTLAVALGGIHYQPAVPLLVEALSSEHGNLRGCAAWSLGELQAQEAVSALRKALPLETNQWSKNHMKTALARITEPSNGSKEIL